LGMVDLDMADSLRGFPGSLPTMDSITASIASDSLARPTTTVTTTAAGDKRGQPMGRNGSTPAATTLTATSAAATEPTPQPFQLAGCWATPGAVVLVPGPIASGGVRQARLGPARLGVGHHVHLP
jgi:hypothetical protein